MSTRMLMLMAIASLVCVLTVSCRKDAEDKNGIADGGTETSEAPLMKQSSGNVLAVEATNTMTLASDGNQLERDFVAEFCKLVATNHPGGAG